MINSKKADTFSDDDVIRSVKDGRIQDFEIIIDRYRTKIINFVYRMIFDFDEAQSISQDVFLKIFRNISRFKEQDNFQSFIFTIAKNMTLNYIKKSKRSVSFSSLFRSVNENVLAKNLEDGTKNLEKEEQEKLLESGLISLGEEQRLALIMKIYLRMSYKNISNITGWSVPKIETLISRAKKKLRDHVLMQEKREKDV